MVEARFKNVLDPEKATSLLGVSPTLFLFNAIMYTFVLELKSVCTVEGWENSLCSPPAQWVAMEGMDRICFKIRK